MSESYISDIWGAELSEFARVVWGHSDAVIRRAGDITYIDLEPYPTLQGLLLGPCPCPRVLIRQEYHVARRALESDTYCNGAVVMGQPGIGKTVFLLYLLVMRLGERHRVALQIPDGRPYYAIFHDSGVSFHSLLDGRPLDNARDLWALTDSNDYDPRPGGIFVRFPRRVRVIQATSPKKPRWHGWSKHAGAVIYIMDVWSVQEIGDLSVLLGLDSERMTFLAKHWGGVPRKLFELKDKADSYIEGWYEGRAMAIIDKCQHIITAITQNAAPFDDAPSQIFFCRPMITKDGVDRERCHACIPTRTILRILGETLQKQDSCTKMLFFNALRQSGETSQAAGMIFENFFHCFILRRGSIRCHWVQGAGDVLVEGQTALVPTNWSVLKLRDPPYLWIAPKNFEGIDSALVLHDKIYAFQVTISSRHRSPTQGIRTFRDKLPSKLKNLAWNVIFVGDRDDLIRNVANQWVGEVFLKDGTEVPIAWCTVDPIGPEIIYQEFREVGEEGQSSDAMDLA